MPVTVNPASEVGFGIIEMKQADLMGTKPAVHFPDKTIPHFPRPDVIPCGEEMGRVQAERNPFVVIDPLIYRRQFIDSSPDPVSLAGRILKKNGDIKFFQCTVDCLRSRPDTFVPLWSRSTMNDHRMNTKPLAQIDFVQKASHVPFIHIDFRDIGQVRKMGKNR
ncbi:MAG: hypothetical protein A4E58_02222 [Syntrophorhabdus sp. PtaB.Bin006]|nr:MAG: hypothetical protein A4E58_02222 [Syntrophorhabdus sp. PtaB.Bin006]